MIVASTNAPHAVAAIVHLMKAEKELLTRSSIACQIGWARKFWILVAGGGCSGDVLCVAFRTTA